MKKKTLMMIAVLVVVLAMAALSVGCGNASKGDSSEESKVKPELTQKDLTDKEQELLELAGTMEDIRGSGIVSYKVDDSVKSVVIRVMEYRYKTKKWESLLSMRDHVESSDKNVQEQKLPNGKLMVRYPNFGRKITMVLLYENNVVAGESRSMGHTEMSGDSSMLYTSVNGTVPIELNKEIVVQMTADSGAYYDDIKAPKLTDYPKIKPFKDFKTVRAVTVMFSDKKLRGF